MQIQKAIGYVIFSVFGIIVLLLSTLYLTQTSNYEVNPITGCQSDSQVSVYCEFSKPEDIVVLPDNQHLLISEFGAIVPLSSENIPGKISLFDTETLKKKSIKLMLGENIWGENNCQREDLLL